MSRLKFNLAALCVGFSALATSLYPAAQPQAIHKLVKVDASQLKGVVNFRDIGGYKTADGHTIRYNLLYRSGQLSALTPSDQRMLSTLRIRYEIDLRTESERAAAPSHWGPNAPEVINIPFIPRSDAAPPQHLTQVHAFLLSGYAGNAVRNAPTIGAVLHDLAQGDEPALLHCTGGQDRTGMTVTVLIDDFVAIQTYTRNLVGPEGDRKPAATARKTQMGWEFYPEALEHTIRFTAARCHRPIIVTENGIATEKEEERIEYTRAALEGMFRCMRDGIPVSGYFHWSAFDNFEWTEGYRPKFGLIAWPAGIAAGKVSAAWASNLDVVPTLTALCKLGASPKPLDGVDISQVLLGHEDKVERKPILYFASSTSKDGSGLHCARKDQWKLRIAQAGLGEIYISDYTSGRTDFLLSRPELYNLDNDPDESYDVAHEHPDVVSEIMAGIEAQMQTMPDNVQRAYQKLKRNAAQPSTPPGAAPRPHSDVPMPAMIWIPPDRR